LWGVHDRRTTLVLFLRFHFRFSHFTPRFLNPNPTTGVTPPPPPPRLHPFSHVCSPPDFLTVYALVCSWKPVSQANPYLLFISFFSPPSLPFVAYGQRKKKHARLRYPWPSLVLNQSGNGDQMNFLPLSPLDRAVPSSLSFLQRYDGRDIALTAPPPPPQV